MSPKRKPMPERELSTHPELLYTPGVKATELTLLGVRIGDPTSRIPLDALEDAGTLERPPDVAQERWSDGIHYLIFRDGRKVALTAEQKLHAALNSAAPGAVKCKPGARFLTRKATVVGFCLEDALLVPYQALRLEELKPRFGPRPRVEEDWAMNDHMGTYYVYPGRQLIIYWDEDAQKIRDISLGRHVIYLHDSSRTHKRS